MAIGDPAAEREPKTGRFLPGASGNPAGRPPAAGHSEREWLNTLTDKAGERGGIPYLETVYKDENEPWPKRMAALDMLQRAKRGFAKSGRPFNESPRDFIHDRTVGKPAQTIHVTKREEVSWEVVQLELVQLLRENPELIPTTAPGLLLPQEPLVEAESESAP